MRRDLMNDGYTILATPHEYHVDYRVYRHEGQTLDGIPLFHRAGAATSPNIVETTDESEVYLSGFVKWDGCSNWSFDELARCQLHACDRDSLLAIGRVMAACWDWTHELCHHWDVTA